MLTITLEILKNEFQGHVKNVECVDLVKSFPTSI